MLCIVVHNKILGRLKTVFVLCFIIVAFLLRFGKFNLRGDNLNVFNRIALNF